MKEAFKNVFLRGPNEFGEYEKCSHGLQGSGNERSEKGNELSYKQPISSIENNNYKFLLLTLLGSRNKTAKDAVPLMHCFKNSKHKSYIQLIVFLNVVLD